MAFITFKLIYCIFIKKLCCCNLTGIANFDLLLLFFANFGISYHNLVLIFPSPPWFGPKFPYPPRVVWLAPLLVLYFLIHLCALMGMP